MKPFKNIIYVKKHLMLNRNRIPSLKRSLYGLDRWLGIQDLPKKKKKHPQSNVPKEVDFLIVLQQVQERMKTVQFTIQLTQQRQPADLYMSSDIQSTKTFLKRSQDIQDRLKPRVQLFGSTHRQKQQRVAFTTKKKRQDQQLKAIREMVSQFGHKKESKKELSPKRKVVFY